MKKFNLLIPSAIALTAAPLTCLTACNNNHDFTCLPLIWKSPQFLSNSFNAPKDSYYGFCAQENGIPIYSTDGIKFLFENQDKTIRPIKVEILKVDADGQLCDEDKYTTLYEGDLITGLSFSSDFTADCVVVYVKFLEKQDNLYAFLGTYQ